MQERNSSIAAARDPRAWPSVLARYREPSCVRSIVELVITAVPFVVLWMLMWAALATGCWVGLSLAVPAAGFLVRLFMIQHDCGHGAFGEFWQGESAGADHSKSQPGDACGDDRNNPVPGEFFHEQISKTGLNRLQRQYRNPQFIVECRSTRPAAD
jgi:hypothetical protein